MADENTDPPKKKSPIMLILAIAFTTTENRMFMSFTSIIHARLIAAVMSTAAIRPHGMSPRTGHRALFC